MKERKLKNVDTHKEDDDKVSYKSNTKQSHRNTRLNSNGNDESENDDDLNTNNVFKNTQHIDESYEMPKKPHNQPELKMGINGDPSAVKSTSRELGKVHAPMKLNPGTFQTEVDIDQAE
mmetsp:Transcript_42256/g.49148  ORF Transcript_42256/g.49148 Transcript_42256/m.49148 type:complete len:119 (-) Transcript_42256:42-398(-)